jgi:DNA-binding response OmpR family regulator
VEPPAASVLVVDDDQSLRLLSRLVLEMEGFEVHEAASVAGAEDALALRRFDVVLMDVHLVGEDTRELLARVRADGIPVAAVTGTADISELAEVADATLMKPFEPAELVAMARRLARVDER